MEMLEAPSARGVAILDDGPEPDDADAGGSHVCLIVEGLRSSADAVSGRM